MRPNPVLLLTFLVRRGVLTNAASIQTLPVSVLLDAHEGTVMRKGNVTGLVGAMNVPKVTNAPPMSRTVVLLVVGTIVTGVTLDVLRVPRIVSVLRRTSTVTVDAPLLGTVCGTVDARW